LCGVVVYFRIVGAVRSAPVRAIGPGFRHISHRAVDVKFDDGRSELFWYYQLAETADG
jgi:hypothetical protein